MASKNKIARLIAGDEHGGEGGSGGSSVSTHFSDKKTVCSMGGISFSGSFANCTFNFSGKETE